MNLLRDTPNGYGWISLTLHWVTGVLVLALLFIGNSIGSGRAMLDLHTSLATTIYLLLVARIVWRVGAGHPGPSPMQGRRSFGLGKATHWLLLGGIAVMLLTGPPMAWTGGIELRLFGYWRLPNPIGTYPELHRALLALHAGGATMLAWGIALHIASVFKHLLINKDETFTRVMVAGNHDASGPHGGGQA